MLTSAVNATCHETNDARNITTGHIDDASVALSANPRSCVLGDPSACGGRGECTPAATVLERSRWSRTESDTACFWLEYANAETSADMLGLCMCDGNYDLDDCKRCVVGFTGDDCSVPVVWERPSLASIAESERDMFKAFYLDGTFTSSSPLLTWVHGTVQADSYDATACPGAPQDPHNSAWILHWHRLYLAAVETVARDYSIALAYWDLSDAAAIDVFYSTYPELEMDGACARLPLPDSAIPTAIGALIEQPSFELFLDGVFNMHVDVHCWFCRTGAVHDGCPGCSVECDAFAPSAPLFSNQEETPLFWAYHTELDRLFELWQQAHGYGGACSDDVAASVKDLLGDRMHQKFAEASVDSCISQMAVGSFNTSFADMCAPTTTLGYRYADSDGGGGGAAAFADAFAGYWWGLLVSIYVVFVARLALHRRRAKRSEELLAVQEDGKRWDMQPNQAMMMASVRTRAADR